LARKSGSSPELARGSQVDSVIHEASRRTSVSPPPVVVVPSSPHPDANAATAAIAVASSASTMTVRHARRRTMPDDAPMSSPLVALRRTG
jgi:hypothetical protein